MIRTALFQTALVILAFVIISTIRETTLLDADGDTKAPLFTLQSLKNNEVSSQDYLGKKTVVYFFAPWCSICRHSISNLSTLNEEDNINVVAIALDYESVENVNSFVADLDLSIPVLYGNEATKEDYKISGYPTYYVLNSAGNITSKSMGYSTELGLKVRTAM